MTWMTHEKEAYTIVMAPRKWAGYIARHPFAVWKDHHSLQSWHKEHVDAPSRHATGRARWHQTSAKVHLTVVYVLGKDKTLTDCLSRWAYPASKGMTDVSTHGDVAETAEAKKIIDKECIIEEEGAKCFVILGSEAPLGKGVGRVVRALAAQGAESNKHIFPRSSLKDGPTTTPSPTH